ncbi:uncharacterized protein LOC110853503 isoform X2 [Folsomia candida]|nr:uncharacterized protein LOC110853503 isoform X2 [Folsomia candida]
MEGDESFSDDEDFVTTQKRTRRRTTPKVVEKKAKLVKAGPSTPAAKSNPSTAKTATAAPDPSKHLAVETTRAPNCDEGELNPPGSKDKEKRKSETPGSRARQDQTFQPVPWSYIVDEEMEVEEEEMRLRDGRGIIYRDGDLAEEFQIRYVASSDGRIGTTVKGEGGDKIRKTILRLVGLAETETTSPDLDVYEASPQLVLTQEEQGLTAAQREVLFQEIFLRGGRVELDDKPGWFLIIHKAPTTGLIHLCLEKPHIHSRGVLLYTAARLCTEPKCYQYNQTLSSDALPKCVQHKCDPIYTVTKVTDYNRTDVLVFLHIKSAFSVASDMSSEKKDAQIELHLHYVCSSYPQWTKYCATEGLASRPIPKSISRHNFNNEGDALRMLSFESTIGMFIKLASGSQPVINLDDFIPLCYGMEGEIDARLKELGIELKIRRHLTLAERKKVKYPFPGEYLLGTEAAAQQHPEKGKTFLYTIMSRNMWYFGWSNTPDFKVRLNERGTDGATEYKRITEKRQKGRELEIKGLKQRDRQLGRTEELCIYPPPLKAPTMTCYLLANCEDDDEKSIKTKTIEAKMIIAGYIAYLLGLRNPIRPNSDVGYSVNKCVFISLVDSNSWGEICEFVKLLWEFEPMLGKYKRN